MKPQIKVGCDPEIFLYNGFEYVSAFGLFPGTKTEPFKLEKGMFQVDGLALEFGIDPAETAEEFNSNIEIVLAQVEEYVRDVSPDFEIRFDAFARFNTKYFADLPDECKLLGCEPDFNLKGEVNPPKDDLIHRPFRSAGGHVHIGWGSNFDIFSPTHFEDCRFLADKFKNKPFFIPTNNEEKERAQYYGNLNPFRPKPYGVELRGPSNAWAKTKETRMKMFNVVIDTVTELSK